MTKISDELRKWCDESDVDGGACDELRVLADRIDAEMVELPKDADGAPIHVGDTVWDYNSATQAGVPFIFAAYGFGNVENVPKIYDIAELPALV